MTEDAAEGPPANPPPYDALAHLRVERRPHGVLLVTLNRPEKLNAANWRMHHELAAIWTIVRRDPATRAVVVTGAGRAFSVGGDLADDMANRGNPERIIAMGEVALDIVYNMIRLEKPVVSAINGAAAGAGLAVALSADISVAAEDAKLSDAHCRIGVASGDHAVMLWPLLCGMAKAKLYLLTGDVILGKEAERIGLVSLSAPREEVLPTALALAERLARGPQRAIRWTKRALNHWHRQAGPMYDLSVAYESLTFMEEDVWEGLDAFFGKRPPRFPSASDATATTGWDDPPGDGSEEGDAVDGSAPGGGPG